MYDLRHTHATALLAAGVNPKVAAERPAVLGVVSARNPSQTLVELNGIEPSTS